MEIRYESREEMLRKRGRPPRQAPAKIIDVLVYTAASGRCATLDVSSASPDEIREFLADLRAAQRHLGGRVHHQSRNGHLVFYWDRYDA